MNTVFLTFVSLIKLGVLMIKNCGALTFFGNSLKTTELHGGFIFLCLMVDHVFLVFPIAV